MNSVMMKLHTRLGLGFLFFLTSVTSVYAADGYVARQDNLRTFFEAFSGELGKPVVVSKGAARRTITGEFVFKQPEILLGKLSRQMGLIWYDDGQSIYLYEAAEAKRAVVSLHNITVTKLTAFLRRSGLDDARFPLRSDGQRTFYISGPPIYVDLISQAAKLMDENSSDLELGRQRIGVIRLQNTFVGDRSYALRDNNVVIPGMATVIEGLLRNEQRAVEGVDTTRSGSTRLSDFTLKELAEKAPQGASDLPRVIPRELAAGNIRVMAYPDNNSLLVKGLPEQVRFIENLVGALDEEKRHVELALWIIDLQKEDLDQLGVSWQGSANLGGNISVSLNGGSLSTLDGQSFVASVLALERKDRARVVSRPVLLTQENTPAIFDNNRTFYTQLIGERSVELQHITYGTLVSVLPRFSADNQIEMSLSIEDGNEVKQAENGTQGAILPTVGRTHISTVARVPAGKSLLVGGYTRDESGEQIGRIPVLGSIPFIGRLFSYRQSRQTNTVRVFLIEPKEITSPLESHGDVLTGTANSGRWGAEDAKLLKALGR
ncbi:Type III secretion outermembrane pore forming protein (YscC,MxiD,HrcC, InvG) [Pseudomonas synxantha]|nr:Type III secretion outermembrane pore forming protein (YscC,MxiD,HrcC, InvG) [Pseudomonas synxantha]AZE78011.1 Type III secretion outermembrane pore forming protein (YscC,MxiD,HrcC, InvG) [Pseudomonas synxantha]